MNLHLFHLRGANTCSLLLLAAIAWSLDGGTSADYQISPRGIELGGGAMVASPYAVQVSGLGGIGGAPAGGGYIASTAYVGQLGVAMGSQTLSLSAATYTISESAGILVCTVLRTGGTGGSVSVPWTFSGGTAVVGVNVAAPLSGTAVLGPGVGSADIVLPVLNDWVATGDLSIDLTLGSPTGASLGAPASAVVTITDVGALSLGGGQPRIVSQPPLWATTGEAWSYTVEVDTRELLPSASLVFALLNAPAGMTITRTAAKRAMVSWPNPTGANIHVRPVLVVTDTVGGSSEQQDILIMVRATPSSGG